MNTLRIRTVISLLVAFVIGIFTVAFFTPTASAADCPLTFEEPADVFNYAQDGTLEFSQFQKQDGQAVIVVTNNSDCELPLALGSYEMMTGNQLSEQQLHDQHQQAVPAQSSRTLKVDLPSCMSQIDLYHDPNEDGVPTPPQPANAKLIGFTFSGNEKDIFAENDIFHFDEESSYNSLDDFPNDDDDGYRNATPSADSRYCDVEEPPTLETPTCPFAERGAEGRYDEVVTLQTGSEKIRSDQNESGATTPTKAISLSPGQYRMTLFGYDQYPDRTGITQSNEQYFVRLSSDSNEYSVSTQATNDLQDRTVIATTSKTINVNLEQSISHIQGRQAAFFGKSNDDGSPNSLTAHCVGVDKIEDQDPVQPPSCPFSEGQGDGQYDQVIDFSDERIRSDKSESVAKTNRKSVNLPQGKYDIAMFAFDQYEGRKDTNQSNEQYFTRLETTDGVFETASTPDLNDGQDTANAQKVVTVDTTGTTTGIQARHSAFFNKVNDDGTPNSHNVGCIAVDRQSQPDPLTGTCSVNPDNPETGQTVTWSSSASGGSGNYTFNWSGDANGDTSTVNETYQTSGQKTASITIGDGNNTITRTCRVNVSDDDDGNGDDPTRLTIIKQVANRDGRDVTSSDFTITATPHTGNSSSYSFPGSSSGVTRDVASIRYNLSETGPEDIDYNTTYSGDCMARDDGGGQVTPESEQTTTCTITNTLEDDNDNGGGNGGGSGGGGAVLDPRDDDDDDDDGQVRGEQDPEFSVQCEPENDTYLIGQQVTFNAEVSGDADNEDVTFDWENGNDLDASNDQATAQYLSAGTKSVTVTAQYDDVTESDVCSVDIRAAANQSGVRLDQLPYTGPGSTAQTLAFGLLILLIATSGSYLALRRFRSDGIPVGIPQDGKQE